MKDALTVTGESTVGNDRMWDEGVDGNHDHHQAVEIQHRSWRQSDLETLKIAAKKNTARRVNRCKHM